LSLNFSEQDEADLKRMSSILDRRKAIAKFFNPNRDPHNGQFAPSEANGGASDKHARAGGGRQAARGKGMGGAAEAREEAPEFHVQQTIDSLAAKIKDSGDLYHSKELCGQYTRESLAKGGIDLPITGSAKDYGDALLNAGFDKVAEAGAHDGFPPPEYPEYTPEKGDVVIIQPGPGTNKNGHMALFGGHLWMSDFFQRDMYDGNMGFWPGPAYRDKEPSFVIYRSRNRK
jgi:hypothetical protein